jgi:ABC-type polysaccharide/polyol phosphate export permease
MDGDGRTELVVVGGASATAADAGRELWQAREVVRAFALRSLRVRYRQAVLGAAWAVVQPLALLVPFVAFLRGGDRTVAGVPYAASTLAALVGWQYLSGAVGSGASSLVSEAFLVRKTWFPREAPVVAAVGAALVEMGIGLAVFAVVGPLLGAQLGVGLLALPLVVAAFVGVALALAVPLAAANALYRDVRHALPFVTLLWLFLSPVAYPLSRFGPGGRLLFAFANPAAGPLDGIRRCLAEGRWPDPWLLGASLVSATVIGWLGHRLFRRLAPTLPDVV